jgi:hypothetical protein
VVPLVRAALYLFYQGKTSHSATYTNAGQIVIPSPPEQFANRCSTIVKRQLDECVNELLLVTIATHPSLVLCVSKSAEKFTLCGRFSTTKDLEVLVCHFHAGYVSAAIYSGVVIHVAKNSLARLQLASSL